MPVLFFVDPKIKNDVDARDIQEITLSYTFYPVDEGKKASSGRDQESFKNGTRWGIAALGHTMGNRNDSCQTYHLHHSKHTRLANGCPVRLVIQVLCGPITDKPGQ